LLNSDTILLNNAVKAFYDYAETAPSNVGCIGCLLLKKDMSVNHSYGRFPTYINSFQEWIIDPILKRLKIKCPKWMRKYDYKDKKDFKTPVFVEYVTGADIFIRKKISEEYGLFDPRFFMYYEETDMQYRYNKKKYQSVVISTPQIIHFMGGSRTSKQLIKRLLPLKSLFVYFKKYRNGFSIFIFQIIFLSVFIPLVLFIPTYSFKDKKTFLLGLLKSISYN
jgi:GT2 family glycosyltransferase